MLLLLLLLLMMMMMMMMMMMIRKDYWRKFRGIELKYWKKWENGLYIYFFIRLVSTD